MSRQSKIKKINNYSEYYNLTDLSFKTNTYMYKVLILINNHRYQKMSLSQFQICTIFIFQKYF